MWEVTADLVISVAYFTIPVQILWSLKQYPRLARMPPAIFILLILFAFFILLCGAGHLTRYLGHAETHMFRVLNFFTAVVSLVTALYLLPLIPHLLESLDQGLQDLVKLNKETAEAKEKVVVFMAFLCHEIRNPLYAITSSASFLGDTDMTEEQRVGVGSIFDSSLLMLRLVNDVLDISKIEAGKLQLEDSEFDFHRMLHNLHTSMSIQISQKHGDAVEFVFDVDYDRVPRIVHGDSTRILQTIYNLLSNSSKFTERGHIKMNVRALEGGDVDDPRLIPSMAASEHSEREPQTEQDDDDKTFSMSLLHSAEEGRSSYTSTAKGGAIHGGSGARAGSSGGVRDEKKLQILSVSVSDTGVGISPDRVDSIFEPYTQAKLSDYRKHGGTGLGLSILYNLVKKMGGKIEVQSTLGEGTEFHMLLPIWVAIDQNKTVHESGEDLSDPFRSCRRLPVYAQPMERRVSVLDLSSSISDIPDEDLCGIEFFDEKKDGQDNDGAHGELAAASPEMEVPLARQLPPMQERQKKKNVEEKKPLNKKSKLPPFHFPHNSGKALVVDDNAVNRKILGKMLTFFNIEHDDAADGQQAVDRLKSSRNATNDPNAPYYGLVFMDLYMPVKDGYDAIQDVRSLAIPVPIVALTANALTEERQRALSLGADEFHTKPILRNEVHHICERLMRPVGEEGKSPLLRDAPDSRRESFELAAIL